MSTRITLEIFEHSPERTPTRYIRRKGRGTRPTVGGQGSNRVLPGYVRIGFVRALSVFNGPGRIVGPRTIRLANPLLDGVNSRRPSSLGLLVAVPRRILSIGEVIRRLGNERRRE